MGGQFCVCTATFFVLTTKMQQVMRPTPGKVFFFPPHIHLLIHAHCISICFPPITSITQSQSFSQHIFHFSLPSLSFINLNISTPTEWLEANTTVAAEMSVLPYVCVCVFSLCFYVPPSLSAALSTADVKEMDPSSAVWSGTGVSQPQGSLGEQLPVEVCLNARGSVCPGLDSLAQIDMSVLLIVGLQEKEGKKLYKALLCIHYILVIQGDIALLLEIFVSEALNSYLHLKNALGYS